MKKFVSIVAAAFAIAAAFYFAPSAIAQQGGVQVITNPGAGECGAGSADGRFQNTLDRLSGTLAIESVEIKEVATDINFNACVTIDVVFQGGIGPHSIAVNGTNIPYRGPFLNSRIEGEFGKVEFDVVAQCGSNYTMDVTVSSTDGQAQTLSVTEFFPCVAPTIQEITVNDGQPAAAAPTVPVPTAVPTPAVPGTTIAFGPQGGAIEIIPGAQKKECGYGFYGGAYDPPLYRLREHGGTQFLNPHIRDIEITPEFGTCLTIASVMTGGVGPWKMYINGAEVPYRGPHLISRLSGEYAYWAVDLRVECGQTYNLDVLMISSVGGAAHHVINEFIPCENRLSGLNF